MQNFSHWLKSEAECRKNEIINRVKESKYYVDRAVGSATCIQDLLDAGLDLEYCKTSRYFSELPIESNYEAWVARNYIREKFEKGVVAFVDKLCFGIVSKHYAGDDYSNNYWLITADGIKREWGDMVVYHVAKKLAPIQSHRVLYTMEDVKVCSDEVAIDIATLLNNNPNVHYGSPNGGKYCIFEIVTLKTIEDVSAEITAEIERIKATMRKEDNCLFISMPA